MDVCCRRVRWDRFYNAYQCASSKDDHMKVNMRLEMNVMYIKIER